VPPAAESSAANRLTARLRAELPSGSVAYSQTRSTVDYGGIKQMLMASYAKELAPPSDVLAKAIMVTYRRRTATSPESAIYVLKKRRFLGMEFCVGWAVIAHPLGGGPPQGYYVVAPCGGSSDAPAWSSVLPSPAVPSPPPPVNPR
jgi:hypothetical protein